MDANPDNSVCDASKCLRGGAITSPSLARRWWLFPVLVFVASRLFLLVALYIGTEQWPYVDAPGQWHAKELSVVEDTLCRHDVGWYSHIAVFGYSYNPDEQSSVAFFPVMPMAIRLTKIMLGVDVYRAGIIVSNSFLLLALLLAYRLAIALGETPQVAKTALLLLGFQPATVFFSAAYSESLFMFLVSGAMLAAINRRWAVAGILGMFASATRNVGVFVAPAIGLMWLADSGVSLRSFTSLASVKELLRLFINKRDWGWVLVIPLGMLAYMFYQHSVFDNAFAFVDVQKNWGHRIVGFWVVLFEKTVACLSGKLNWINNLNLVASFLFIVLGIGAWKRYGAGIGVFCLACVLIPSSATIVSMTRYVAVIVPSFFLLAVLLRRMRLHWPVIGASAALSVVIALCYSHWMFIG